MKDQSSSAVVLSTIFASVLSGVWLAAPSTSFAAEAVSPASSNGSDDAAAALLARGTELRRAGRDEEALQVFERAQAQHPSPQALAQVALAEQAIGRWVAAERDLAQALASADNPWITRNQADLTSALGYIRAHLGKVEVLGSPAGAAVLLNGARVGTLPLAGPLTVAAGDAVVGVTAEGYAPLSRKITIEPGTLSRETIDLPALSAAAAVVADDHRLVAVPPQPPTALVGAAARIPSQLDTVDDRPWTWRRTAAVGVAAIGVVGLGLGIGFGLASSSKHDDAAKVCPGSCSDQHGVDLWNQARSAGNVSTAAFVVAAAGLAGGAALWLTAPRSAPVAPTQIGLGLGTIQLKGTW